MKRQEQTPRLSSKITLSVVMNLPMHHRHWFREGFQKSLIFTMLAGLCCFQRTVNVKFSSRGEQVVRLLQEFGAN